MVVCVVHITVKKLFGGKREMRRELSAKTTIYNSFSYFAKELNLPFGKASGLWMYMESKNRGIFASLSKKSSCSGKGDIIRLKKRVDNYPLSGPLGSQDPILPICTEHLYEELNKDNGRLKELWKKDAVNKWMKQFDAETKPYKPTKRAASWGR